MKLTANYKHHYLQAAVHRAAVVNILYYLSGAS